MHRFGLRSKILSGSLVCLCLCLSIDSAFGQEQALRVYEEQLRVQLDEQAPEVREMAADAGAWLNVALFHYDDAAARRERSLRLYEIRPWASVNLFNTHSFYVRAVTSWYDWSSGDNPQGTGDDYEDPSIERLWYEFNLAGLSGKAKRPDVNWRLRAGRDFSTIGTGLSLATTLDMVRSTATLGDLEWMAMLGKSNDLTFSIDDSIDSDDQDLCVWGTQLTYTRLANHRPFVYFLNVQDNTDPLSDFQNLEYSSRYVGAGSTGSLLPDLRYQGEIVGQWGKTYSWGSTTGRDDIQAWSIDLLLEYFFRVKTSPRIMAEYMRGSGDSDRAFTSSGTVGGNTPGTQDNAFNSLGFRDTGLALAPRLSNLNIYVLGASFFPLEHTKMFRRMEVGTRVFFYQKATGGPISDTTATEPDRYVGFANDVFVNWRITSDLSWTIRYGGFAPGDSYSGENDSCRTFFYTGFNYSF